MSIKFIASTISQPNSGAGPSFQIPLMIYTNAIYLKYLVALPATHLLYTEPVTAGIDSLLPPTLSSHLCFLSLFLHLTVAA